MSRIHCGTEIHVTLAVVDAGKNLADAVPLKIPVHELSEAAFVEAYHKIAAARAQLEEQDARSARSGRKRQVNGTSAG